MPACGRLAALAVLLLAPLPALAAEPCANGTAALAPDAAAAEAIAVKTIAERQKPDDTRRYRLIVEQARDAPGDWTAYQVLANSRATGGGGLEMRIDRCTGEVRGIHLAR